jgi:hypothetical protein
MKVRTARIAAGLGVVLVAAALGFAVATRLAPEQLRQETERRLAEAIHAPVSIGQLRLKSGPVPALEGLDLELWTRPDGATLTVERATATLDPLALFAGRIRVSRLLLEGARLGLERDAEGRWGPEPFGGSEPTEAPPNPDEWLAPLIQLELAIRALLEGRPIARELVVRDSRVEWLDAASAPARRIVLRGVRGRLDRTRLRSNAELALSARLEIDGRERGRLVGEGRRSRDGAIRFAVAATDLDLESVATSFGRIDGRARIEGRLSGILEYRTPQPGEGRLELDVLAQGLTASVPAPDAGELRPLHADRAAARIALAISPDRIEVSDARIASGALDLQLEGRVGRPLQDRSPARLALEFRDVALPRLRELLGWIPEALRDEAVRLLEPVETGRLARLVARGEASLADWRGFLTGRTEHLPADFGLEAEVADLALRLGDGGQMDVRGRISWSEDRFALRDARGQVNGTQLPRLDLSLDGVSHLFAAEASRRAFATQAHALPGLGTLWRVLTPPSPSPSAEMPATVEVEIDAIHSALLLWPLEQLHAVFEPIPGGVRIGGVDALWAGVPVMGEARWLFEPAASLSLNLTAAAPARDAEPALVAPDAWASGRFRVGPLHDRLWQQESATGSFRAYGSSVELSDVVIELAPRGQLITDARLELGLGGEVPFELNLALADGDAESLLRQWDPAVPFANGSVDLAGTFQGTLRANSSPLPSLSGLLHITARAGEIHRALPAVVAIALASDSFNPFARRESIRYELVETTLAFERGLVSSDSFLLDGPDLRVFASGSLDLGQEPHPLEADVALFLFRQLDRAIEKIPLLNLLLLGTDESLVAAYFELSGPWRDPKATLIPLRSLASGPADIVLKGVPKVVLKGVEALGSLFGRRESVEPEPPEKGS